MPPIIDYTAADYEFNGMTTGFDEALETAFTLQQTNVEALEAAMAAAFFALHGQGREPGGCILAIGAGLSATLTNDYYWIAGRRYLVAAGVGTSTVSLSPSVTNHIYQDALGAFVTYTSAQSPVPAGYWYAGTATCSAVACTAVSETGSEEVASIDDLDDVKDAVGWPYTNPADVDTRLVAVEADGGGGGVSFWATMPKASGDTTTPGQEMATKDTALDAAHVAAYHAGETASVADAQEQWDVDAVNQAKQVLYLTRAVAPDLPETQTGAATVVWDNYGYGEGNDNLNFVDAVNSTWLPA